MVQVHRYQLLSYLGFFVPGLKTRLLERERFPHPYKECFVLLSNQRGISQFTLFRPNILTGTHSLSPINVGPNPPLSRPNVLRLMSTPFEAQPPCYHIAQSLALIRFVTTQAHELSLSNFLSRL